MGFTVHILHLDFNIIIWFWTGSKLPWPWTLLGYCWQIQGFNILYCPNIGEVSHARWR